MGLDIKCECGEISFRAGSYSSFHWFRTTLGKALGYRIIKDETGEEDYVICFGYPMAIFLIHSDCDGVLAPSECEILLKDLLREKKRIVGFVTSHLSPIDADYFLKKLRLWQLAFEHSIEKRCKLIFY